MKALTKRQTIDGPSCLTNAGESEPVFVLRAKDPCAADTIRAWAKLAEGHHEKEKIARALEEAKDFDNWREIPF